MSGQIFKVKRTYLMGYSHSRGFGSFVHYRETDDDPTYEQINRMQEKMSAKNGCGSIAVISVSRIGNDCDTYEDIP